MKRKRKITMQRAKPTRQSYFDNIYRVSEKETSVIHARISLSHFDRFCDKIYKNNPENVIDELKIESKKDSEVIINFLEDLINYLSAIKKIDRKTGTRTGDKIATITVKGYFADIKRYIRHYRIPINNDEIREFVKLPKTRKEIEERIELKDIQKLIDQADSTRRVFYKLLATSGIRLGEVLQLRKNHFDMNHYPIRIHVPSNIAKNGHARISFTTKEVSTELKTILNELEHDDLVFNKSESLARAKLTEETYFARLRVKCGIAEYEPSGKKHRVRMHKLRKWFNSTVTNGGMFTEHRQTITGWDSFEGTYHEYSAQELGEAYLKVEKHLFLSPEWRAKYEISQKDNQLMEENEKLTSSIRKLENKVENQQDTIIQFLELEKNVQSQIDGLKKEFRK